MLNNPKNQRGAVLAVSLIILVLMTVVVVVGMQGSHVQEQIAGNTKKQTEAALAAESGMARAASWLKRSWASRTTWNQQPFYTAIQPLDATGEVSKGAFWVESMCFAEACSPALPPVSVSPPPDPDRRVRIIARGYSVAETGSLPTPSATLNHPKILAQATLRMVYDHCAGPEFKYGLVSKQQVRFGGGGGGQGTVNTHIYTDSILSGANGPNASVALSQQTVNGNVNAFGTIDAGTVTGDKYCPTCGPDKQPTEIEVPVAATALPGLTTGLGAAVDCSALSGDLGGGKYFCQTPAAGSKALKNDMFNGTLYFAGSADIDFSGGVGLGQASKPLTVVATGDITFNGGDKDSYFNIWTDGQYQHNGGRSIFGSIIAGNGIDWNGTSTFTAADYGNPGTPCRVALRVE